MTNLSRIRKHGFRARMKNNPGIINSRRAKGRHILAPC